jgi:hypothetical protein
MRQRLPNKTQNARRVATGVKAEYIAGAKCRLGGRPAMVIRQQQTIVISMSPVPDFYLRSAGNPAMISHMARFQGPQMATVQLPRDDFSWKSESPKVDGRGGNRTCQTNCCNDLPPNDLRHGEKSLGAFWEWTKDRDCHLLSLFGNRNADSFRNLLKAWPFLPPHIREAIFTLIDAAKFNSRREGVSSCLLCRQRDSPNATVNHSRGWQSWSSPFLLQEEVPLSST